jgi:hypothetical protein
MKIVITEKQYTKIIEALNQEEDIIMSEEEGEGGGESAPAGSSGSVWPISDVTRGPANPISNDKHYTSGPHPFSSPWEDKTGRGPGNQLT